MGTFLWVYLCIFSFIFGCFMCVSGEEDASETRRNIWDAFFYAVIWPVTILAYIEIKLSERRNRK